MQVLLSIIFKSYLTAKFLHHEDNENNTFSGAASRGWGCTLPDNVGLPVSHERAEECHPIYVSLVPKARCNSMPPLRIALMQLQI